MGPRSFQRAQSAKSLLRLLRHHFRGWKVVRVLRGTDRTRHQTAALLRVLLWDGRHHVAALILYPGEPSKLGDRLFSSLLLWWDHFQNHRKPQKVLILLPESCGELLLSKFPRVNVPMVGYKYDLANLSLRKIYPCPIQSSSLTSLYVLFPYGGEVPPLLGHMKVLYPFLDLTCRRGLWEVSYLGLPIAWHVKGRQLCFYGLRHPRILTSLLDTGFGAHLQEVVRFRSFPPQRPNHPWYRFGHERWLESLILKSYPVLNPDFGELIYPQVPTSLNGERKVLDLLTVTKDGQLAVLELKTQKDLDLIFQGLDYWERVTYHLGRDDFQKAGYFKGITLSPQPPSLYLICPLFEFHRVMPVLRKHLKDDVTIECVGINSDWKRGIQVLRRFDF